MIFQPELEAMPRGERSELQARRLAELLGRLAASDSRYWREKLAGISAERIRAIEDVRSLPFTTKAELLDHYPFGALAVPLAETVRIHASSGTRGKPTVVAYTAADVDVFAEVNARSIACAGAMPDDVLHVAYGYGLFTGGLGLHYGGERLGATVVPASGGNPGFQVQLLADLGARGIACTPSFCLLLAERAAADGLLERVRLTYGVLGAEPWSESMREKLETAWGDFDACDIYGLSEVIGPGVAMECREGRGALHVFDDHFYPEIVDPESGDPVETGSYGELVLTTLRKEALPVIRYRTRDVTRFVEDPCACGRTHARIARFAGRVDDMLVIRGVNVFPSAIEDAILADADLGGQYAIVVDRRAALPELEVHAELAADELLRRREAIAARLGERLHERLRLRVVVSVGAPGSIPRQDIGKAKRVFERTDERDELAERIAAA
ncbi:MAG: phenylacetate--CoA ligase [Actinomycetota bacterium]|nr:phenylacetate--CoA ligase [Actinomycetota bacterium]